MDQLERDLERYLEAAIGLQVTAARMPPSTHLPHFLVQLYELKPLQLNGRPWLGVFLREGVDLRPAAFEKHVQQLPLLGEEGYFLVARALPGYVRRRLIERKLPFVIPGSQLYLPQLGMELRPRPPQELLSAPEKMSPVTQLVVMLALNNRFESAVSPRVVADYTGYTPMSMTRAWNELEALGLGLQTREGKQRLLSFPEGERALWEKARPLMRNPVQESVIVLGNDIPLRFRLLAGESALAAQSSLVPPKILVYAMGREDWRELEQKGVKCLPWEEPGTCRVQVWRYDPQLIENPWHVDPFSLYLSLQDETDERVQTALDEMMGHYEW